MATGAAADAGCPPAAAAVRCHHRTAAAVGWSCLGLVEFKQDPNRRCIGFNKQDGYCIIGYEKRRSNRISEDFPEIFKNRMCFFKVRNEDHILCWNSSCAQLGTGLVSACETSSAWREGLESWRFLRQESLWMCLVDVQHPFF